MFRIRVWLLKGLLRLLSWLPLRVHYALGRFVAWLAGNVVRYRRAVVDGNLALCFPEKSNAERKAIRKDFYRHFGDLVAETVWFGGCRNPERLRRQRLVEIENPDTVAELLRTAPSLVILSSHCGNWELFGGIGNYNYTDTPTGFTEQNYCVVYREQSSKVWNEVLGWNRLAPVLDKEHFEGYLEMLNFVRYAFRNRDRKKVYDVRSDQRPYTPSPANIEVEFLGQKVDSMTGAAALARKFGMAVAVQSMRSDRRGHYILHYTPVCTDASTMSAEEIMQQYYRVLEADIRQQPELNLWTHKRFIRI